MDPIFKHSNGGSIYVGNQTAAADLASLTSNRITHVVNCTSGGAKIPDFHKGKLNYMEFPITFWNQYCDSDESVIKFADGLFSFIDSALEGGNSVLVHCLAGAHRAGTTGCVCLMHYAGLPPKSAIAMAKKCREIIGNVVESIFGSNQLPSFAIFCHMYFRYDYFLFLAVNNYITCILAHAISYF